MGHRQQSGVIQGQSITSWANSVQEAVDELRTNNADCGNLQREVCTYLEEKGVDFSTGAYYPHTASDPNPPPQLQIELRHISFKMYSGVLRPGLEDILRRHSDKSFTQIMSEGDKLTWDTLILRIDTE